MGIFSIVNYLSVLCVFYCSIECLQNAFCNPCKQKSVQVFARARASRNSVFSVRVLDVHGPTGFVLKNVFGRRSTGSHPSCGRS